jgi:hypothetical protein
MNSGFLAPVNGFLVDCGAPGVVRTDVPVASFTERGVEQSIRMQRVKVCGEPETLRRRSHV